MHDLEVICHDRASPTPRAPQLPHARAAAVTETLCPGQTRPGTRRPLAAPGGLISQAARRADFRGPYRTNTLACPARSRKYCGATPSTTVTATPTAIVVIVSGEGTATEGPPALGSLKNISTMTRM
jgi:hypothetical protein